MVEPEDEEEVGPPPSAGHFNNCVPVRLDSCPYLKSQVCKQSSELYQVTRITTLKM